MGLSILKRVRLAKKIAKTGQIVSVKPVVRSGVRVGDAFVLKTKDGSTIRIVVDPKGEIRGTTQW